MSQDPGNSPQVSPDGHWMWNGTEWVPNVAATPAPASPPPSTPTVEQSVPPVSEAATKTPWFKKWWGIAIIALGALTLVSAVIGSSGDSPSTSSDSNSTSSESSEEPTDEATDEPKDEATDEPVEEPEPVNVYENFGTFTPVKDSGSGDSVVKLGDAADATAVAVTAKHQGSSNFVIEALNSDNDTTELLVNTIGGYSGTTFLPIDDVTRLKITADGSWSITVSPIADMKEIKLPQESKGDKVLTYSGDAADWAIKHNGESNFAMYQITDDGQDLLINEIGTYSGTIPMSSGPSIIIMTADGTWTVKNG